VKFGFLVLLPLFYFQPIYFIPCVVYLFISKEIHKVIIYVGVRNRDFNMVSKHVEN
jgi:hypothetical protein